MFLKADTSLVFRRCLLSCIWKEKSQFFSLWFRLTSAFYQGQHNSFTGILMTQSCRTLPLWSCVGHSVSAYQFPTSDAGQDILAVVWGYIMQRSRCSAINCLKERPVWTFMGRFVLWVIKQLEHFFPYTVECDLVLWLVFGSRLPL